MAQAVASQEKLLPLDQAVRHFAVPPHPSTLHKWASRGLHGAKLRVTRIGTRIYVTKRDLADFQRAVDDAIAAEGAAT